MNNNLPEIKRESIFTKIKKWLKLKLGMEKIEEAPILEEINESSKDIENKQTEINEFKKTIVVERNIDDNNVSKILKLNGILTSKDPTEYELEEKNDAKNELSRLINELEQSNPETLIEAIRRKISVIYNVSNEFINIHPEVIETILDSVRKNGICVRYVKPSLQKQYPNILMEAVKNDAEAIFCTSMEILDMHPEIVIEAAIKDRNVLQNLPEKYNNPMFLLQVENEETIRKQENNIEKD